MKRDLQNLETKKQILENTELFVLDMDGTFYLDNDILDGALDFLSAVKNAGKDYLFFTNNSSTSPALYIEKLARMNCHITRDQIMTSGDVMIPSPQVSTAVQVSLHLPHVPLAVPSSQTSLTGTQRER